MQQPTIPTIALSSESLRELFIGAIKQNTIQTEQMRSSWSDFTKMSTGDAFEVLRYATRAKCWPFIDHLLGSDLPHIRWESVRLVDFPRLVNLPLILIAAEDNQWDLVEKIFGDYFQWNHVETIFGHYIVKAVNSGVDNGAISFAGMPDLRNLLILAATRNQYAFCEKLVSFKVDVDEQSLFSHCPKTVSLLLRAGGCYRVDSAHSPVIAAARKKEWDVVRVFLDHFDDKQYDRSRSGWPAAQDSLNDIFRLLITAQQYDMVELLVKKLSGFWRYNTVGGDIFRSAVTSGNNRTLDILLGYDIFRYDIFNMSLIVAFLRNHSKFDCAGKIISSHAVNVQLRHASKFAGNAEKTLLFHAFSENIKTLLTLLIKNNLEHLVLQFLETPYGQSIISTYPLVPIMQREQSNMLHLLLFLGADPNLKSNSTLPVQAAIQIKNPEVRKLSLLYLREPRASLPQFFIDHIAIMYLHFGSFLLPQIIASYLFGEYIGDYIGSAQDGLKREGQVKIHEVIEEKEGLEKPAEVPKLRGIDRKKEKDRITTAVRHQLDARCVQFFTAYDKAKNNPDEENPLFFDLVRQYLKKIHDYLEAYEKKKKNPTEAAEALAVGLRALLTDIAAPAEAEVMAVGSAEGQARSVERSSRQDVFSPFEVSIEEMKSTYEMFKHPAGEPQELDVSVREKCEALDEARHEIQHRKVIFEKFSELKKSAEGLIFEYIKHNENQLMISPLPIRLLTTCGLLSNPIKHCAIAFIEKSSLSPEYKITKLLQEFPEKEMSAMHAIDRLLEDAQDAGDPEFKTMLLQRMQTLKSVSVTKNGVAFFSRVPELSQIKRDFRALIETLEKSQSPSTQMMRR
jgi:hypothetical protein